MTNFGKILVLANLGLSLVFAAMALAIRTHRIDWSAARVVPNGNTVRAPNPSGKSINNIENTEGGVASAQKDPVDPTVVQIKGLKEGKTHVTLTDAQGKKQGFDVYVDEGTPGKLAAPIDRIRELEEIRARVESYYDTAYRELGALEKQRPLNQAWYEQQLQLLERGEQPVMSVVYEKGLPKLDSQERPVMEKAATKSLNAIKPREAYMTQLENLAKDIQNARDQVNKQLKQQEDLSKELEGIRADLAAQEEALRKIREESEYLRPRMYNSEAEAQLLRDRQQRLDERLQELRRAAGTTP